MKNVVKLFCCIAGAICRLEPIHHIICLETLIKRLTQVIHVNLYFSWWRDRGSVDHPSHLNFWNCISYSIKTWQDIKTADFVSEYDFTHFIISIWLYLSYLLMSFQLLSPTKFFQKKLIYRGIFLNFSVNM